MLRATTAQPQEGERPLGVEDWLDPPQSPIIQQTKW